MSLEGINLSPKKLEIILEKTILPKIFVCFFTDSAPHLTQNQILTLELNPNPSSTFK